jgi:peroxiredoxin
MSSLMDRGVRDLTLDDDRSDSNRQQGNASLRHSASRPISAVIRYTLDFPLVDASTRAQPPRRFAVTLEEATIELPDPPVLSDEPVLLGEGTAAPDFSLKTTPDQLVCLSDFSGRPLVLVFYPADWSPVCGDELALYNELREEFDEFGAAIVGISVDGPWCHRAFAEARHLHFPLLSDFHPKGEVCRSYHVYRESDGTAERALYVIDAKGIVRWSYLSPIGVNPGADGIMTALERLTPDQLGRARRERRPGAATSDASPPEPRDETRP